MSTQSQNAPLQINGIIRFGNTDTDKMWGKAGEIRLSPFSLDKTNPRVFIVSMTFDRGHLGFLIAFLIVGGVLGSAIGTFLASTFPLLVFLKHNLTGQIGFNLEIISFGMTLNIASVCGMVLGFFVFWKV